MNINNERQDIDESLSDIDIIRRKYMNIFGSESQQKGDTLGSSQRDKRLEHSGGSGKSRTSQGRH